MSKKREAVIGIAFGIGAGMCYGVSSVLIKHGVGGMAPPLVGAAALFASARISRTRQSGETANAEHDLDVLFDYVEFRH